jgi:hypothetical protein
MWRPWERDEKNVEDFGEKCRRFWWKIWKEKAHSEDLGVDGMMG